jgi:hypothetical protein
MMRALILAFTLLASWPAAAQTWTMQWLHCQLVPAYTSVSLDGTGALNAASFSWPYTVQEGYVFGITDVQFSSKFTTSSRASYFVLNGVMTVSDNHGSVHFRTPLAFPPGSKLSAGLINNDDEQQWMCAVVVGQLVKLQPGALWTQVFGPPAPFSPLKAQ